MNSRSSLPTVHRVLPSAYFHVVFPVKGQIFIENIPKPIDQPFIAPILSCFKEIRIEPGSTIFGLHLHPSYGSMLFGGSPSGLIRNAHLIKNVFATRSVKSFTDSVQLPKTFEDRIDSVLRFFATFDQRKDNGKRKAIASFFSNIRGDQHISLKDISSELGYSTRWIQKLHKEVTGISPKEMICILRFNKLINSLYQSNAATAQVALDSGYYDQAHAIHEFQKLGGLTPGDFSKMRPDINRVLNSF